MNFWTKFRNGYDLLHWFPKWNLFFNFWSSFSHQAQSKRQKIQPIKSLCVLPDWDVHAKMSLNEAEPTDLDMEDELLKILQSLHNALDTFVHFPVCRWQVITGALKAFYHKHQPAP